jgi:hypothetical protein
MRELTAILFSFDGADQEQLRAVIASREAALQDSLAQRARKEPHPKESAESASELGASRPIATLPGRRKEAAGLRKTPYNI